MNKDRLQTLARDLRSGSNFGRIATENPEPELWLRNYAACRGARSATNPTTNESGAYPVENFGPLFLFHVAVGGGSSFLRIFPVLARAQVRRIPVPPVMLSV